ncbi:AI-2E family transporter [Streptomyces sp. NBC_01142]|uniref:AI-2E family transporter n=1 Tax=Streptomyces sp. NBC_01142 TaxID=2975865 RepID=UPI002259F8A2|nr:AI-2E family transporter [Streptomyces sp. NBC_01142]MCX4821199.1 AI-2E family transporter [Streptomyces sp. NBC_01142]
MSMPPDPHSTDPDPGAPSAGRRHRIRTASRQALRGLTRPPAGKTGSRRTPPHSRPGGEPRVFPALQTAAAYAWRILVVGGLVYAVFSVLGRFHEIGVAVFLGLVGTAMLRPLTDLLARVLPRPLAVTVSLLGSIVLVLGVLTLVGEAVAGERAGLAREFGAGVGRIERWLEDPPFRLNPEALTDIRSRIGQFLSSHRSTLVSTALSGAGRLVEVLTVFALALFCSIFFIHSGDRQWGWFCDQLPPAARERVSVAGRAAWRTFTGYTHGIVLVAATNAILVGVALFALGVPLAVPLALLEFFAAFIPLIGSPIALAVAAVVALAAKGPLIAAMVVALIVIIGQIEGHLLHPLVMSWAVRLHPVVVALSVVGGAIAAGVVGAVVAVPLVSVVWSAHQALRRLREPEPLQAPAPDRGAGPSAH